MGMKYQVILQHNEEDCGAACLAAIAKYYGRFFSINRVREVAGTGPLGTTLLNLRQGAKALLFDARGVKAPLELIDRKVVPLPGIIHWKGNHWVVLYGRKGNKYVIADPAVGMRYLSRQELLSGWANGVMLLLEPRPDFQTQPDDRNKVGSFNRVFQQIWNYRILLAEALLLNFVLGLLSLTSPFLLQILTDDVLIRGDTYLLNSVIIAVLVMHLISSSLKLIQSNLVAHFAQRLELNLVLEFGRTILSLPLPYYESHRSGEIISRLRDIQAINQLISQAGIILPNQIFIALVSLGFMLVYSPQLLLVALAIAVIMTLSTVILIPKIQQKIRNLLALTAENQSLLIETFKGAITLKTKNAAPQFFEEFQIRYGRQATLTFSTLQMAIVNNVFSGFVSLSGETILLWFGSSLVFAQTLSIGQLLAFNTMNRNCLILITTILSFVNQLAFTQTAIQRLMDVIDSTPEVQDNTPKPRVKIPSHATITCTHLNFHHMGRVELLQDFSLTLPGGKVIALIGKSGCGKSTLAKLIAGLYLPQSGNIRIDAYNLQDLSLDSIRRQIILIPQEAHFWSRSIIDNLTLGNPQIGFEQIVKACQIARADEFISKLPNKYQTILGEFGANLSGGQRQRLAIALGIVTDPPILILDESTASLDPVSEAEVLDRLLSHRQGKTTILISHRPRVINRADWIVFLEEGQVKLQGSPEVLRSKAGEHLDFLTP
jgi:ATP-binding cassette, subfamily C, bacterial